MHISGYCLLACLLASSAATAAANGVAWDAMITGSPMAGQVLYGGDGTFYGQQKGQDDWGTCSYGSAVTDTLDLDWATGVETYVALNSAQFNSSYSCGLCLWYRGVGGGIGTTPIPLTWTFGFVDNLCPECAFGAIDLDSSGNGRWGIEWFPAPCNVGNGTFRYTMSGDMANPYWFQFGVADTRVPVAMVEMSSWGKWFSMRRGFNNMFAANGGPFTFPISIRLTSVLGDVVYDEIPEKTGGWGTAQFPDKGPATFPSPSATVITAATAPQSLPAAAGAPRTSISNVSNASSAATAFGDTSTETGVQVGIANARPPAATVTAFSSPSDSGMSDSARGMQPSPQSPAPVAQAPKAVHPSAPLSTISSSLEGDGKFPVVPDGQCGGKDASCGSLEGTQCQDQPWSSAECPAGYGCQRWTEWWWQCVPDADIHAYQGPGLAAPVLSDPAAPAKTLNPTPSHWQPQDGMYDVQLGDQCGGSGGVCSTLGTVECKDGPWDGATCPPGVTCTRKSMQLWTCGQPVQSFGRRLAATGHKNGWSRIRKFLAH